MRRLLLLPLLLVAGCAHDYFSGSMDLERIDKGEIYVETTLTPGDRAMFRLVFTVDAPAWRLMNVQRDLEDFPLWDATLEKTTVLAREGDHALVEIVFKPIFGHRLSPLREDVRYDAARNEVSYTGFQSDWVKESQLVVKFAPMGDGSRTLVNLYFLGEITASGQQAGALVIRSRYAQSAQNLRRFVNLPQYGQHPPDQTTRRSRVVVPNFAADGVAPEIARTATRVFAEQLMRAGTWDVSTPQEITALLSYAQQQMLIGCDGGAQCATNVGKALGADQLVTGTVGKVGDRLVVTASLIRLADGTVERRTSRDAPESGLLDTVREAATDLVKQ